MKLYREKYAGAANAKASGAPCKENQGKHTNGSYGKNKGKDFKKGNENNRSSVNAKPVQGKKTNEKKSFFGKLKSLFGKKK